MLHIQCFLGVEFEIYSARVLAIAPPILGQQAWRHLIFGDPQWEWEITRAKLREDCPSCQCPMFLFPPGDLKWQAVDANGLST